MNKKAPATIISSTFGENFGKVETPFGIFTLNIEQKNGHTVTVGVQAAGTEKVKTETVEARLLKDALEAAEDCFYTVDGYEEIFRTLKSGVLAARWANSATAQAPALSEEAVAALKNKVGLESLRVNQAAADKPYSKNS